MQKGTASEAMCRMQSKPEIQYLPVTAQLILETSGRGSFIAPAVGFLHYGPSCYLYDHVCNFNYQGRSRLPPVSGQNASSCSRGGVKN